MAPGHRVVVVRDGEVQAGCSHRVLMSSPTASGEAQPRRGTTAGLHRGRSLRTFLTGRDPCDSF